MNQSSTESALPSNFTFSQSSLQAYENCARRFWLAYVEKLPWPAVEASPIQEHEELLRLGSLFHRLVERAEIGLDVEQLQYRLEPPLADWFRAYVQHRPDDLPDTYVEPERILTVPFGREAQPFRLAAKYDLIAADGGGRVVIVDWKTTRRRTDPGSLRRRLQTLVYPYVLVEASASLPFGPIQPEQVEMLYWFAVAPLQPFRIRYDSIQHENNRKRLAGLLDQILAGSQEEDFPKVADTETNRRHICGYCVYRSRCNRGIEASDVEELDDLEEFFGLDLESALEFTLDDVDELAF
ncbi:MAG: PD-(D/E)XK nuclease family protein [Chloroflexota bacterium]